MKRIKQLIAGVAVALGLSAVAEPSLTLDEVTPGKTWNLLTVNYTLDGVSANTAYEVVFDVTVNGVTKSVTNAAAQVANKAYAKEINTTALFGEVVSDSNAKVRASLVALPGVRLWENGPYFAECNVGATKQEDYGFLFWWGDTVGYGADGKAVDGSGKLFKDEMRQTYIQTVDQLRSNGFIDDNGNLVAAHDAATAKLGAPWRMPTKEEVSYFNVCSKEPGDIKGVKGYFLSGKGAYAEKRIFLPYAGFCDGFNSGDYKDNGKLGCYWASTVNDDVVYYTASGFILGSSGLTFVTYQRFYGFAVRAVRDAGGTPSDGTEVAANTKDFVLFEPLESLKAVFADCGDIEAQMDDAGQPTNFLVTVTNDIRVVPVTIPEKLGNVKLDLNGHSIKGKNGAKGDEETPGGDGEPAIIVGLGTSLFVTNTKGESGITGGNGGEGCPPGKFGSAIAGVYTTDESVGIYDGGPDYVIQLVGKVTISYSEDAGYQFAAPERSSLKMYINGEEQKDPSFFNPGTSYDGKRYVVVSEVQPKSTYTGKKWYDGLCAVASNVAPHAIGRPYSGYHGNLDANYLGVTYGTGGTDVELWTIDELLKNGDGQHVWGFGWTRDEMELSSPSTIRYKFKDGVTFGGCECRGIGISKVLNVALGGAYMNDQYYPEEECVVSMPLNEAPKFSGAGQNSWRYLLKDKDGKVVTFDSLAFSADGKYVYTDRDRGYGGTTVIKWRVLNGLKGENGGLEMIGEIDVGLPVTAIAYANIGGEDFVFALLAGTAGVTAVTMTGTEPENWGRSQKIIKSLPTATFGTLCVSGVAAGKPHLTVAPSSSLISESIIVYDLAVDGGSVTATEKVRFSQDDLEDAGFGKLVGYCNSISVTDDEKTMFLVHGVPSETEPKDNWLFAAEFVKKSDVNHWEIGAGDPSSVTADRTGYNTVVFKPARGVVTKAGLETVTNALGRADFVAKLVSADGSATNDLKMVLGASGAAYDTLGEALAADEASYTLFEVPGYFVSYDANGAAGEMATDMFIPTIQTNLTAVGYSAVGYAFAGWTKDGTTVAYTNRQEGVDFVQPGETLALKAKWTDTGAAVATFDALTNALVAATNQAASLPVTVKVSGRLAIPAGGVVKVYDSPAVTFEFKDATADWFDTTGIVPAWGEPVVIGEGFPESILTPIPRFRSPLGEAEVAYEPEGGKVVLIARGESADFPWLVGDETGVTAWADPALTNLAAVVIDNGLPMATNAIDLVSLTNNFAKYGYEPATEPLNALIAVGKDGGAPEYVKPVNWLDESGNEYKTLADAIDAGVTAVVPNFVTEEIPEEIAETGTGDDGETYTAVVENKPAGSVADPIKAIYAEGLLDIATSEKVNVKLEVTPMETVSEATSLTNALLKALSEKSPMRYDEVDFVDLSVYFGEAKQTELPSIITIHIPRTIKSGITYGFVRWHGGEPLVVPEGAANAVDGEYFEIGDGEIVVHMKKFSSGALGEALPLTPLIGGDIVWKASIGSGTVWAKLTLQVTNGQASAVSKVRYVFQDRPGATLWSAQKSARLTPAAVLPAAEYPGLDQSVTWRYVEIPTSDAAYTGLVAGNRVTWGWSGDPTDNKVAWSEGKIELYKKNGVITAAEAREYLGWVVWTAYDANYCAPVGRGAAAVSAALSAAAAASPVANDAIHAPISITEANRAVAFGSAYLMDGSDPRCEIVEFGIDDGAVHGRIALRGADGTPVAPGDNARVIVYGSEDLGTEFEEYGAATRGEGGAFELATPADTKFFKVKIEVEGVVK